MFYSESTHSYSPFTDSVPSNIDVQLKERVPSLFVLNAAALTKPHAVQPLPTDMTNYGCYVVVITEMHCKTKHTDAMMNIPEYMFYCHYRLL